MEEVTIEWMPKKAKISQMYSTGLEYAFVTKDWKQVNQLVYCKDFLQDALCAMHTNQKMSIYGFSYDPNKSLPVYLNKTRILVTSWRDKTFPNRIEGSLDFLNQIEDTLKMSKTKILKVKDLPVQYKKAGAWIYEANKRWMKSPPLISLYTLLIRVSLVHVKGTNYVETMDKICNNTLEPYQSYDRSYLRDARKGIDWILTYGDKKLFPNKTKDNFKDVGVSAMHNYVGICGYSNRNARSYFPEWYDIKEIKV